MEILMNIHDAVYRVLGDSMYFILGFLALVAVVAQWRLYEKAGQPGWPPSYPSGTSSCS